MKNVWAMWSTVIRLTSCKCMNRKVFHSNPANPPTSFSFVLQSNGGEGGCSDWNGHLRQSLQQISPVFTCMVSFHWILTIYNTLDDILGRQLDRQLCFFYCIKAEKKLNIAWKSFKFQTFIQGLLSDDAHGARSLHVNTACLEISPLVVNAGVNGHLSPCCSPEIDRWLISLNVTRILLI